MRIKAKEFKEDEVTVNIHVNLDSRGGTGYETDIKVTQKQDGKWVASMEFSDMPPQESFEDAIDRLGLYLQKMAVAVKSKNLKYLNPEQIFTAKYK
jgi:hypothetical protein